MVWEERQVNAMNNVQVIYTQEIIGRTFQIYGTIDNPLFLAKDVASWIEHSDVSTMVRSVDDNEKVTNNVCTLGGVQNALFLTEDGLFEVLMLSRKPIAKQFKTKVKEVLRSIRKNGMYAKDELLDNPDLLLEVITKLKTEREQKKLLQQQLEESKPKLEFYEAVTGSKDAKELGTIAKVLNFKGYGRNKLFDFLRRKNILMYNNQPYQKYIDSGWFRLIEQKYQKPNGEVCINIKTLVYQKGVEGIRKLLREESI